MIWVKYSLSIHPVVSIFCIIFGSLIFSRDDFFSIDGNLVIKDFIICYEVAEVLQLDKFELLRKLSECRLYILNEVLFSKIYIHNIKFLSLSFIMFI